MEEKVKKNPDGFISLNFFVEVIKSSDAKSKTYIVRCPRPDGSAGVCAFGSFEVLGKFFDSL